MLTKGGHKNYCFVKRCRYSLPVTVIRYEDHILSSTSNGVTGTTWFSSVNAEVTKLHSDEGVT
jgi:hypothetical protein